jgi:hypothetical protein
MQSETYYSLPSAARFFFPLKVETRIPSREYKMPCFVAGLAHLRDEVLYYSKNFHLQLKPENSAKKNTNISAVLERNCFRLSEHQIF